MSLITQSLNLIEQIWLTNIDTIIEVEDMILDALL